MFFYFMVSVFGLKSGKCPPIAHIRLDKLIHNWFFRESFNSYADVPVFDLKKTKTKEAKVAVPYSDKYYASFPVWMFYQTPAKTYGATSSCESGSFP